MFESLFEAADVLRAQFNVFQFSLSVEFVVFEVALVLDGAFEDVSAVPLLESVPELPFVIESVFGLVGAFLELVVVERPNVLVSVRERKFAVLPVFLPPFHVPRIHRPIAVPNRPLHEFSLCEGAIELPIFVLPHTLAVGYAFAECSGISISIFVLKFAIDGHTCVEISLEDGAVGVYHFACAVGPA